MNSVFKIKRNTIVNLKKVTSSLLNNVTKFNFFTINKTRDLEMQRVISINNMTMNGMTSVKVINSLHLYKHNKFYFSEKPEKKEEEEEKPPKGFEKFYRKKKTEEEKKVDKKTEEKSEHKDSEKDKEPEKKPKKDEDEEEKEEEEKDQEKDKEKDKEKEKENWSKFYTEYLQENYPYMIGAAAILAYLIFSQSNKQKVKEVTVNEFNTAVEQHQIQSIEITKDKVSSTFFNVLAQLKDGSIIRLNIINHEQFLKGLETRQYDLGVPEKDFIPIKLTASPTLYAPEENSALPAFAFGFLAVLLFKMYKNFNQLMGQMKNNLKGKTGTKSKPGEKSGGLGGFKGLNDIFDYGKSNVKEFGTEQKINVRFKQVAGMEQPKKEVMEFVDFLKHPEKYHRLGAKIPRGALLVGPPGTGKTMLAKAVAGEAGVPFFAMSGSDFVEMFVGVGASRVRDLFKKAKDKSPSIIFIDEIDAVGRKRGGKFTGGHDERDNTLNQLLVEMDGFGTENNVIVLAATNRADILDNALLRPGRFDRQIEISLPDRKEREQIFKIYLKKVKLDMSRSIEEYAMRLSTLTPGFSGADIANLVNEAAIISARHNKDFVDADSFESASDRIIAGLETRRLLSEKERKIVAYHESGHAVVGWFLENSSPLVKLTIIPRSKGALGFTQFVPDDIFLRSTDHLYDLICGLLGGRMAEEHFFGSITTGASDDLQKVTSIANAMVTKYGMSKLGLQAYSDGGEEGYGMTKPFSSQTESLIEGETSRIINDMAERTRQLIKDKAVDIENLAQELLKKETLDLLDIIRILGERPFPMSENMKEYMKEIEMRKKEKPLETKADEENKDEDKDEKKDKDKKDDDFEKGKDKDESGGVPPPKKPVEKDIVDAETIMK